MQCTNIEDWKLYRSSVKYNNQQQYKAIIEASMVSSSERCTDNSKMSPGHAVTFKNTRARKSLRLFTEVLYVENKTAVRRLGDAK